jgi:hypothetical protein
LGSSAGHTFTIHSTATYLADSVQSNYAAGFSSQGPTDVDFRVKPDLSAPGVNVLSSIPMADCDHGRPGQCFALPLGHLDGHAHLAGSCRGQVDPFRPGSPGKSDRPSPTLPTRAC